MRKANGYEIDFVKLMHKGCRVWQACKKREPERKVKCLFFLLKHYIDISKRGERNELKKCILFY